MDVTLRWKLTKQTRENGGICKGKEVVSQPLKNTSVKLKNPVPNFGGKTVPKMFEIKIPIKQPASYCIHSFYCYVTFNLPGESNLQLLGPRGTRWSESGGGGVVGEWLEAGKSTGGVWRCFRVFILNRCVLLRSTSSRIIYADFEENNLLGFESFWRVYRTAVFEIWGFFLRITRAPPIKPIVEVDGEVFLLESRIQSLGRLVFCCRFVFFQRISLCFVTPTWSSSHGFTWEKLSRPLEEVGFQIIGKPMHVFRFISSFFSLHFL